MCCPKWNLTAIAYFNRPMSRHWMTQDIKDTKVHVLDNRYGDRKNWTWRTRFYINIEKITNNSYKNKI